MNKKIAAERQLRDAVALRRIGIFITLCMCIIIIIPAFYTTMNPSVKLIHAGYQKAQATIIELDGPIPDLPKSQWEYDYNYYYTCEFVDENKNIRQGELCELSPNRKDFKYKLNEIITIYYPENFQDGNSVETVSESFSFRDMSFSELYPLLFVCGTLLYLVISYIYKRIQYERIYGLF